VSHPLLELSAVHDSLAAFYRDLAESLRARGLRMSALSADSCATAHSLMESGCRAQYHLLEHVRAQQKTGDTK
jgi:hypothetical protein